MSRPAQVAQVLIAAWRDNVCRSFEALEMLTEAEAYRVQQIVAKEFGWFDETSACAWKLGGSPGSLISAARVPQMAVHPSGWNVPAGYCHRFGIESELVVRLGCDLDENTDLRAAHDAVDAWIPAIELCDTRFDQGECAHPLLRLADQQLNRALVLGRPARSTPDWLHQRVEVRINNQLQVSDMASHPFSDPLTSVPWLARHAATQGRPLKRGDLIATGSWTGLYWAPPGSDIELNFPGVGNVLMRC